MKLVIAFVWLGCLYNLFVPFGDGLDVMLHWVLIALPLAHLLECIIFRKRVEAAEGDNMHHYIQIFFFGGIHLMHMTKQENKKK
ncbi:DUF1145 domain-containing protein [Thalassotalea crassostreae]|uniref:DUF1145 domain-containing protein n=1 Tax=Thalassotalea crassostreae TaxID=1763536 RepID=UPI00083900E2|nr:DUF1145 domain-containing protein [Thalassotalea crassostreae]